MVVVVVELQISHANTHIASSRYPNTAILLSAAARWHCIPNASACAFAHIDGPFTKPGGCLDRTNVGTHFARLTELDLDHGESIWLRGVVLFLTICFPTDKISRSSRYQHQTEPLSKIRDLVGFSHSDDMLWHKRDSLFPLGGGRIRLPDAYSLKSHDPTALINGKDQPLFQIPLRKQLYYAADHNRIFRTVGQTNVYQLSQSTDPRAEHASCAYLSTEPKRPRESSSPRFRPMLSISLPSLVFFFLGQSRWESKAILRSGRKKLDRLDR